MKSSLASFARHPILTLSFSFLLSSLFLFQSEAVSDPSSPLATSGQATNSVSPDQTAKPDQATKEDAKRQEFRATLDTTIRELSAQLEKTPNSVDLHSRRGDQYFFRGRFPDAVADYEKMVSLQPSLETSHWRRGIAYFYANRFQDAAHQFEIYHSFDDVDRENGIWRFLSQTRARGIAEARKGLLKYKKDDREPFPDVYKMFAGELTGREVLDRIRAAKIQDDERRKREFYAHLYVGLFDLVEGRESSAVENLRQSTANIWGRDSGFGPNYMWHVGRVQLELLTAPKPPSGTPKP